jgi:sec-independent protein translocase protein TatC
MTLHDDGHESGQLAQPFMEHLGALRRALLFSLVSMMAGMVVSVPATPLIMRVVKGRLSAAGVGDPTAFLKGQTIMGGASSAMTIMLWTGILLSAPFVLMAFGSFLLPALRPKERRLLLPGLAAAAAMFALGAGLGFILLPMAIRWLLGIYTWMGVSCDFVQVTDFVGFVGRVLLCFGLAFEVPLLIAFLGYMGIVSSRQLRDKRRHVIVVLSALAMVLTPGPDPVSMAVVAAPMVLLFEGTIWFVWAVEHSRMRA